jgi:hypothetical protein
MLPRLVLQLVVVPVLVLLLHGDGVRLQLDGLELLVVGLVVVPEERVARPIAHEGSSSYQRLVLGVGRWVVLTAVDVVPVPARSDDAVFTSELYVLNDSCDQQIN